jgi:L-ascorbate metabolism protein UlaG (beta-lactamase superfamily)
MAYDDIEGSVIANVEELATCIDRPASSKRRGARYRSSKDIPMPGGLARAHGTSSLHLAGLIILAFLSLAELAMAVESLCEPGFVRRPVSNRHAMPVAVSNPDMPPRVVTIQWLGHSSFLITTPGGTAALTDPHPQHTSPTAPDIVTISNEHFTHNQAQSVPSNAQVLRGRTGDGVWIEVNVVVGDLSIKGLPSSGGNAIDIPVQNTIFVFRTEGLCIVHLGNLRQPLNEAQRQRLGRPDVLMIPIDGQWTLSFDQIAVTITQLRPAIVLPMHYDFPEHAQLFMQFIKETVPVRTKTEKTLHLTRTTLPGTSEVLVVGYRE